MTADSCRFALQLSLFQLIGLLLLAAAVHAEPAPPKSAKRLDVSADSTFAIEVNGGEIVVCAPVGKGGAYVPGRFVRHNKFPSKQAFVTLKSEITAIQKLIKLLNDETAKSKRKKRADALKRRNSSAAALCQAGQPPPPSPTATAAPLNPPIAYQTSVLGNGLEPLAVTFSVDAVIPGTQLNCQLVSAPDELGVDIFPDCTALVRPRDHRVGGSSFQFKAIRSPDGQESNIASVLVSWSQEGSFIGDKLSIGRYKDTLTAQEARHLMRSVGFSADMQGAVNIATQPGGLDALLEKILSPAPGGCQGQEQQAAQIANAEMYVWCSYDSALGMNFCLPNTPQNRIQWGTVPAAAYWLHMMRYGCEPLRERIGLMWHNHFAINNSLFSGSNNERHNFIKEHLDLLRSRISDSDTRLFVSFKELLERMHGKDGSMLYWLDNRVNTFYGGGNENYARELMELFSLGTSDPVTGAPNYNEQHVYDMRFAVMGYNDRPKNDQFYTVCCDPNNSATGPACQALAQTGQNCRSVMRRNFETYFDDARWNLPNQPVRVTLFEGLPWSRHDVWKANLYDPGEDNLTPYLLNDVPGTPRYIAARLIASFASLEMTEEMVSAVSQTLKNTNYDIKAALNQVLGSSSFFAPENMHDGVMNPIESQVGFLRGLGLPLAITGNYNLYSLVRSGVSAAGQTLLELPTVFGVQEIGKITGGRVHDGKAFVGVQRWLERWRYFALYLNYLNSSINLGLQYSWFDLLPGGADNRDANRVLDHILNRIGLTVTPQQRTKLIVYLTSVVTRTKVENGITVPDPEFTYSISWSDLTDTQFNNLWLQKGPGLLTVLYSMPEMHTR